MIFSYYVEFQPKQRRGSMISLLATFWMSGSIICAGKNMFALLYSVTIYWEIENIKSIVLLKKKIPIKNMNPKLTSKEYY